ncbi:hypothetical protein FGG78_25135 [Thioclava sp. BHET1]|nr:hypothetical protein FGG78_25135 [Thioclava sp. BHET1]
MSLQRDVARLDELGMTDETLSQLAAEIRADRLLLEAGPNEAVFWRKLERIKLLEDIVLALAEQG